MKTAFLETEMRIKTKHLLFILFLICSLPVSGIDELRRGLFFQSFEVDKDKRTCLNLTPDKPFTAQKGFSMEFDFKLRPHEQNFGYIFRIIGNDTLNIDFLTSIDSEVSNFSLVIKNRTVIEFKKTEIGDTIEESWIKALFTFNPVSNTISLSLNGVKKEANYSSKNTNQFAVYFGGNTHDVFSTTDIAPMTIRDIRIFDATSNLIRHWKLESHIYNNVYDECEFARAVVSNPQWEIDSHINWNKRASFILPGTFYCMAFDQANSRIFVVKDKHVLVYNIKSNTTDTIEVRRGIPFNTEFNHLEYNPVKDELISYCFESNHLATFNFQTAEWNNEDNTPILPHDVHHSQYYIAADSLLTTFGGYGYHLYKSILHKYNSPAKAWEEYDLSATITPRYLGSMGYIGNKELLYFGGFGNESGRQEEFPRNYYDLYSINIDSVSAKKIWELPKPKEDFTNSNSLLFDKKNRKFYTLSYPNKRYASVIKLHEYSLDKPEYRIVGDSIPYNFNDVDSYCDLFQGSDSTELYAVTSYVNNNNTEIRVYSIAFPPLSIQETLQGFPPSQLKTWNWWLLLLPFVCLIIAFIIYKKRRHTQTTSESTEVQQTPENEEESFALSAFFEEKKDSFINLLGNFQIVDNNGDDITKNFTPTTTQLFLLLLLPTIKNGKGITAQELRNILWYDKNGESARNNRNVYINKLRSILKSFEGVKVVNHEGYWTIQSEKKISCDYEKVLVLIKMLQTGHRFDAKLLNELVDTASKGTLLPHIQQTEWLESYQTDYTNQLIECLLEYSKRDEAKEDLPLSLKIADVILLHDNIDEDAIKFKCYALYHLGRKNQALQAFNKFAADYEVLLATKPNFTFEDLII